VEARPLKKKKDGRSLSTGRPSVMGAQRGAVLLPVPGSIVPVPVPLVPMPLLPVPLGSAGFVPVPLLYCERRLLFELEEPVLPVLEPLVPEGAAPVVSTEPLEPEPVVPEPVEPVPVVPEPVEPEP
jgi:hypothetical protein